MDFGFLKLFLKKWYFYCVLEKFELLDMMNILGITKVRKVQN